MPDQWTLSPIDRTSITPSVIITGTRVVCQWIMLLHYTNVLLVQNERFPNFAEQSAQFFLLYNSDNSDILLRYCGRNFGCFTSPLCISHMTQNVLIGCPVPNLFYLLLFTYVDSGYRLYIYIQICVSDHVNQVIVFFGKYFHWKADALCISQFNIRYEYIKLLASILCIFCFFDASWHSQSSSQQGNMLGWSPFLYLPNWANTGIFYGISASMTS